MREGNRGAVYATRMKDREVLDPLGIHIESGARLSAVVWNGREFLVVSEDNQKRTRFTFVSEAGVVTRRSTPEIDSAYELLDVGGAGSATRLLFARRTPLQSFISIFDGAGSPVAVEVPLPSPAAGHHDNGFIAGSRDNEFLLLRTQNRSTSIGHVTVAVRITFSGVVQSSVLVDLPEVLLHEFELEGSPSGYLLLQRKSFEQSVHAFSLAIDGRPAGASKMISSAVQGGEGGPSKPTLVYEEGGYFATWETGVPLRTREVHFAELSEAGVLLRDIVTSQYAGFATGVSLAVSSGERTVVFSATLLSSNTGSDVYAHTFGAGDETTPRKYLLTYTREPQSHPRVAATPSGFAAVWQEATAESPLNVRFTLLDAQGAPVGTPLDLGRAVPGAATAGFDIAVTADRIVVARHLGGGRFLVHRFSLSGLAIDTAPLEMRMAASEFAMASSATEVLLGGIVPYATPTSGEIILRRIPSAGPLPEAKVLTVARDSYDLALGSDGAGFLAVWSEGVRTCQILCAFPPFKLRAARLSSGGTALDTLPLVLEDDAHGNLPSVAWDGSSYVVIWNGGGVKAVRISSAGSIIEPRTVVVPHDPQEGLVGKVISTPSGALVLFMHGGFYGAAQEWAGLLLPQSRSLAEASLTRARSLVTEDIPHDHPVVTSLAAAARGTQLLLLYERVAAREIHGGVPRVWSRLFSQQSPRRRGKAGRR